MSRPQPDRRPPPVQRLRVRYAKRGRARFTSHRDFGRAFERALRRAGVPMAYSSGYSPHPRISYAGAAPTGAASEAEYLEIALAEECDPDAVRSALDAALPAGLDIVEVSPASGPLAESLTASRWLIEVDVDEETLRAAVAGFLAAEHVEVRRMTKSGMRAFDARAAVVDISVGPGRVEVVLAHQVPSVRPDDVLAGLATVTPSLAAATALTTRMQQGTLEESTGALVEPR